MARSDTTTSSTPFSPFSTCSATSEATSDDLPDLGAFTNVFRALNDIQPRNGIPIPIVQLNRTPTSSLAHLSPEPETPGDSHSTIWTNGTILSYISRSWQERSSFHSPSFRSRARSLSAHLSDESDTEGEDLLSNGVDIETLNIDEAVDLLQRQASQPSLGYLDEALGFIAAERARLLASRDTNGSKGGGSRSSTSENAPFRHVIHPRRKRQRKKTMKSLGRTLLAVDPGSRTETADGVTVGEGDSLDDSSSSFETSFLSSRYKTSPATPRDFEKRRRSSDVDMISRILHTRSTPSLRLPKPSLPLDPRVLRLRALAHKLRLLFPEDAAHLSSILSHDQPDDGDFVDPRGPSPGAKDTLVHIFVDHSNILIGFLSYLKRHPAILATSTSKRLSHAALALILERGRSVTRRVLVTSSPLYQPMDSAEQLGYEVRIYARVPDTGDGMDRQPPSTGFGSNGDSFRSSGGGKKNTLSISTSKTHKRSKSSGATSESDPGPSAGAIAIPNIAPPSTASNGNTPPAATNTMTRIKYREQGVDELLQLKLHQAIADIDVPPPNATIVLATGDGNVGQFNEDGFLGCVRTALKKGWRVELYAWEEGLSKSWKREFGLYNDRFTIVGLNKFAVDLLEV